MLAGEVLGMLPATAVIVADFFMQLAHPADLSLALDHVTIVRLHESD